MVGLTRNVEREDAFRGRCFGDDEVLEIVGFPCLFEMAREVTRDAEADDVFPVQWRFSWSPGWDGVDFWASGFESGGILAGRIP